MNEKLDYILGVIKSYQESLDYINSNIESFEDNDEFVVVYMTNKNICCLGKDNNGDYILKDTDHPDTYSYNRSDELILTLSNKFKNCLGDNIVLEKISFKDFLTLKKKQLETKLKEINKLK